jgi:hypothetical protein
VKGSERTHPHANPIIAPTNTASNTRTSATFSTARFEVCIGGLLADDAVDDMQLFPMHPIIELVLDAQSTTVVVVVPLAFAMVGIMAEEVMLLLIMLIIIKLLMLEPIVLIMSELGPSGVVVVDALQDELELELKVGDDFTVPYVPPYPGGTATGPVFAL